ncbi:MAG: WYL domain-containing protein, partial [Anaerolineaceae bacterium]
RYLSEIKDRYIIHEDPEGSGKYRIPYGQNLRSVRLHPFEALTVYLALRRFIRQTNKAPDFMISAIQKIIPALARPEIVDNLVAANEYLQEYRPSSGAHTELWRQLIDAWLNHQVVRIDYQKPGDEKPFTHTSEVYLFEPMRWGDGVYVIIRSRERVERDGHGIRQLKIDRIARVTPTMETFEPDMELDIDRLMKHALGVWFSDDRNPISDVVLRFTPDKAMRVMESIYVEVEEKTPQPDGSLIWRAQVANLREIEHWVLSWGAGVEVLQPARLRERIAAELRSAAGLYGE